MNQTPTGKETDSTVQIDRQPSMDWLHEEPPLPQGTNNQGQQADAAASDTGPLSNKKPKSLASRAATFIFSMLAVAALAYFALKPHPPHKSVALEAERGASEPSDSPNIAIGEAAPLTPPTRMTPESFGEAKSPPSKPDAPPANSANAQPDGIQAGQGKAQPSQGNLQGTPDLNLPAEEGKPVAGQPETLDANLDSQPTPAADSPSGAKAMADIARRLDVLQALVERLERTGRVQASRLDGLELVNAQPRATLASDANGESPGETGNQPAKAKKAKRKPASPRTALRQADGRPQRTKPSAQPLPFMVESVDVWDGQKTVVIRQNGQLIDVRPGERRAGWRIDSADGQAVTLSDPSGSTRTVMAGEGGRP